MRYDFYLMARQKRKVMQKKTPEDDGAENTAQSLRCQAIERLNADFGPAEPQFNDSAPEEKDDQIEGVATKKISGWWLPFGIVASIAAKHFGLKSISYDSYTPYTIGMACALLIILLGICFFEKLPENNIRYDLSSGPAFLVKVFGWQMALMAFILGWIIGDLVLFKLEMY